MNDFNNKSPLRYPGGKTRACKTLDKVLCTHFDLSLFKDIMSPFFGGGSFEFYIQNKYNLNIVANDKFTPLYSFWKSCKMNKEYLCKTLFEKIGSIEKKDFKQLRDQIMEEASYVYQGVMYFIINRCSFSGSTLSGGFSLESSKNRFTETSVNRIKNLNLSHFEIYNLDFQEFLNTKTSGESSLVFLDPPYYLEKKSKLYGKNGDMHEHFDHGKLFRCLQDQKNWLMTYNNCPYIKELYKEFIIIETGWTYGMNKTKLSSEIVIIGKKK